jgi:ribose transport system ATP-binding protein
MKVLSGAHQPDQGHMWLDGERYQPRDPADGRAAGVAMIYQELSLAQHLSVAENVLLGVEPRLGSAACDVAEMKRRVRPTRCDRDRARPRSIPLRVPRRAIAADRGAAARWRSRGRWPRGAACWCWTSRPAAWVGPTSSGCSCSIRSLDATQGQSDRLHLALCSRRCKCRSADRGRACSVMVQTRGPRHDDIGPAAIRLRSSSMMVGREGRSELYPSSRADSGPRSFCSRFNDLAGVRLPSAASLDLHAGVRSWASPDSLGAGRTELHARGLRPRSRSGSGTVTRCARRPAGAPRPARRWSQGLGHGQRGPQGARGSPSPCSIADNTTTGESCPADLAGGSAKIMGRVVAVDRQAPIRCRSAGQPVSERCPGATSRRSRLPGCSTPTRTCCCSTSPRAASTSARRRQIYRCSIDLAVGDAAGRRPRAVLMISSYLPELLGVCDRIAVMCRGRAGRSRGRSRTLDRAPDSCSKRPVRRGAP